MTKEKNDELNRPVTVEDMPMITSGPLPDAEIIALRAQRKAICDNLMHRLQVAQPGQIEAAKDAMTAAQRAGTPAKSLQQAYEALRRSWRTPEYEEACVAYQEARNMRTTSEAMEARAT